MTWLRANRWYLVALAVLLPAAILVALSTDWWRYAEAENGRPIEVHAQDSAEYAGATFTRIAGTTFAADSEEGAEAGLLPGTSLVSVTLLVNPGAEAPSCEVDLSDGTRSWPEASSSDATFDISSNAENYCSTDAAGAYLLQVYFVVPDAAAEHPRLELRVLDALPDFLSFEL